MYRLIPKVRRWLRINEQPLRHIVCVFELYSLDCGGDESDEHRARCVEPKNIFKLARISSIIDWQLKRCKMQIMPGLCDVEANAFWINGQVINANTIASLPFLNRLAHYQHRLLDGQWSYRPMTL